VLLIPGLPLDGDAVHVLQVGAILEDVVGGVVPVTEPDVLDGESLRVQTAHRILRGLLCKTVLAEWQRKSVRLEHLKPSLCNKCEANKKEWGKDKRWGKNEKGLEDFIKTNRKYMRK
jgi:hypothetical protein